MYIKIIGILSVVKCVFLYVWIKWFFEKCLNEILIDNGERYFGNFDGGCKIKCLLICFLDIKFIFFIYFLVNSVFVGKYFDLL